MSSTTKGTPRKYPKIPTKRVTELGLANPLTGLLAMAANVERGTAEKLSSGTKPYVPKFREMGWNISIATPIGFVTLWSCWVGNQIVLRYPKELGLLSEAFIKERFGMEELVRNYRPGGGGGNGVCMQFKGQEIPGQTGRVWMEHTARYCGGFSTEIVDETSKDGIDWVQNEEVNSFCLATAQFSRWVGCTSEEFSDSEKDIQPLRDVFIGLACELVDKAGGATATHFKYDFTVIVPEQLETLGYQKVTWLKGKPTKRKGFGNDVVRAEKEVDLGREVIVLKTAGDLVPWVTLRKVSTAPTITIEMLHQLLTF